MNIHNVSQKGISQIASGSAFAMMVIGETRADSNPRITVAEISEHNCPVAKKKTTHAV